MLGQGSGRFRFNMSGAVMHTEATRMILGLMDMLLNNF